MFNLMKQLYQYSPIADLLKYLSIPYHLHIQDLVHKFMFYGRLVKSAACLYGQMV